MKVTDLLEKGLSDSASHIRDFTRLHESTGTPTTPRSPTVGEERTLEVNGGGGKNLNLFPLKE